MHTTTTFRPGRQALHPPTAGGVVTTLAEVDATAKSQGRYAPPVRLQVLRQGCIVVHAATHRSLHSRRIPPWTTSQASNTTNSRNKVVDAPRLNCMFVWYAHALSFDAQR